MTVSDMALLVAASLVTHLDDAKAEPRAFADGRHGSLCVFCDLLDESGAIRVVA